MTTNITYQQHQQCLSEDMNGELLVYQPESATTLHLNGPSAIVWSLCTGEHAVQDIIDIVSEAFPEQAEQIPGDIIDVVNDLAAKNFLVKADKQPPQ